MIKFKIIDSTIHDLASNEGDLEIKTPVMHSDQNPCSGNNEELPALLIEVSEDNMLVFLSIDCRPPDNLSVDYIIAEFENQGIVFGIDREAIENFLNNPSAPTLVASGINPVKGQDARIQYFYEREPTPKPVLLANGMVDYYELGKIIPIYAGDVLALREPAGEGSSGTDVYGRKIAAPAGENMEFKVGRGVIITQNKALAEHEGSLSWINDKLHVSKLYLVSGDVDFSTGNIDFMGKVLISGNVCDGFKVEADHDIDIRGGVGNALINSRKGSVFVKAGIIGRGKALITAHKNVEAKFVQAATVFAGHSVVINEYIVRCIVNAGDSVLIQGRKGRILGNNIISAKTKIKASRVKNARQLDLKVEGIERKQYYARIHELNRSIERLEARLREYAATIRNLRSRQNDVSSLFLLEERLPEYMNLQEESDIMIDERNQLNKMLKSTRGEGMIEIGGGLEEGMSFSIKHEFVKLPQCVKALNMYYDPDEKKLLFY